MRSKSESGWAEWKYQKLLGISQAISCITRVKVTQSYLEGTKEMLFSTDKWSAQLGVG